MFLVIYSLFLFDVIFEIHFVTSLFFFANSAATLFRRSLRGFLLFLSSGPFSPFTSLFRILFELVSSVLQNRCEAGVVVEVYAISRSGSNSNVNSGTLCRGSLAPILFEERGDGILDGLGSVEA